jgi:predicted PolB exonuclease-like 3'-5' exonuclease
MAYYYDENFGGWDGMDDPDMVEFYHQVQAESVEKVCVDCGRTVRLRPDYECCSSCADRRERGGY